MDEHDGDVASDFVAAALNDTPLYEIPDELIDKWQALPQHQRFSPVMPRIAWDRLYRVIELLNRNNFEVATFSVKVATATITRDLTDVKTLLKNLAENTLLVENSLKQFQEMLMKAAIEEIEGAKVND